ncbi:MAG: response regulator [Parcubacteria group bacterium]|nr:response regulator [Parcubacteria group bacterium]
MPHNPPLVLYVEDDGMLLTMYKQFFTIHGFAFEGAADFKTGKALIPEKMPDLVLLDLLLPDMWSAIPKNVDHELGLDILKGVKADPKTRNIPVIVLSNIDQPSVVAKAKALGAEDFLVKAHVVPREVLAAIKKIFDARGIPLPEKRVPKT